MSTALTELLQRSVDDGTVPGAVALLDRAGVVEVATVGYQDLERAAPMTRDTIFRIASITKPLTAAALLLLVDDATVGLDDPVSRWLPELASPMVVRTPVSAVDDLVPADRPITVFDLLTGRAGWGFPSDFSYPQVQQLFTVQSDGREVQQRPAYDAWLTRLAQIPLLYQPGEAWLYDTSSDLQGILISRVAGRSLSDFFRERLFAPLGIVDTDFVVPAADRSRFASYYRGTDQGLELADGPDGQWSTRPAFESGAGGLAGPIDSWHRFGRMLLNGGRAAGQQFLSPTAVELMTTNHLTTTQREIGALFLEGQGWGCGGAVDLDRRDSWTRPGRYGWVGGTGTTAHIIADLDTVAILLTQRAADDPVPPAIMRDFWTYAASS